MLERRQNYIRNTIVPYQRKCKTPSIDISLHFRKKYTLTDNSLKKNSQAPRKNSSLPKYLPINTQQAVKLKTKKNNFKTLTDQYGSIQQTYSHSFHSQQIDLSTIMDINGKQLTITFNQGAKEYQNGNIQIALKKFQYIESFVGNLNTQILCYLGSCYSQLGNYYDCIRYLNQALQRGIKLNKNIYLKLTQAYKKTNNYLCAISVLDKCIKVTNPTSELYLQRARLHVLVKNYNSAFFDYNCCLELNPNLIQAKIQRIDMIYHTQGLKKAISCSNQIILEIENQTDRSYIIYRKALLLMQEKQYKQALKCFDMLTSNKCPSLQSQIHYYRGIIQSVLGDFDNALLQYQQSINSNTSSKFTKQAQYQKIMILLKKKNYYGAQYQLERVQEWSEDLTQLQGFVQGVIAILKMKVKKGVDKLAQVIAPKYFENTLHSFRGYGFYMMRDFQNALKQLNKIQDKLCQANLLNQTILQAMLNLQTQNYKKCLSLIENALKIEPQNTNTLILKALCHICLYNSNPIKSNKGILLAAQQILVKANHQELENDVIPYLSSLVNYQLEDYQIALDYIRSAIQLSQNHMIKHYYLKAMIKMTLGMYQQALNDFSNSLIVSNQNLNNRESIDETQTPQKQIEQIYLYRAVCYIKLNNRTQAQQDLKTFYSNITNFKKYKQFIHYFELVGASDILLELLEKNKSQQFRKEKMKCYFLTKQLNQCLVLMKKICEEQDNDNIQFDWHCLSALKQASSKNPIYHQNSLQTFQELIALANEEKVHGEIFSIGDCYFYAGVASFILGNYKQSREYMLKSQKIKINQKNLKILKQGIENQENYQNCIYSKQEIQYNIGLTYLLEGQLDQAFQILQHYPEFQTLINQLISGEEQTQQQSQFSIDEANILEITPFPIYNRLCSIFQSKIIKGRSFKLSFCLPEINILPIYQGKCYQLIKNVGLNDIQMKPSAPWIRKNSKGIIFTDKLTKQSIDLKSVKNQHIKNNNKQIIIQKQKKI